MGHFMAANFQIPAGPSATTGGAFGSPLGFYGLNRQLNRQLQFTTAFTPSVTLLGAPPRPGAVMDANRDLSLEDAMRRFDHENGLAAEVMAVTQGAADMQLEVPHQPEIQPGLLHQPGPEIDPEFKKYKDVFDAMMAKQQGEFESKYTSVVAEHQATLADLLAEYGGSLKPGSLKPSSLLLPSRSVHASPAIQLQKSAPLAPNMSMGRPPGYSGGFRVRQVDKAQMINAAKDTTILPCLLEEMFGIMEEHPPVTYSDVSRYFNDVPVKNWIKGWFQERRDEGIPFNQAQFTLEFQRHVTGEVRPPTQIALLEIQSGSIKQGTENVSRYYERFHQCARILTELPPSIVCERFLFGLGDEMRRLCCVDREGNVWGDIHALVKFCHVEEHRLNMRTPHFQNSKRLAAEALENENIKRQRGSSSSAVAVVQHEPAPVQAQLAAIMPAILAAFC